MKIFISYRRTDSQLQARLLRQCVEKYVKPANVFMDVHSIPEGVDFANFIGSTIEQCDLMFVLIGPNWLEARGETGQRRLDEPGDFVRNEISAGLRRSGLRVIPLLLDGATVPEAGALPADIAQLPKRNGHKVRAESFESDVDILLRRLGLDERSNTRRRLLIGAGAIVLAGAGAAGSVIARWPPQFYNPVLPDHVANAVTAAREAEGKAAALIEEVEQAALAAQNAKARAQSAGDGAEFEFGAASIAAGRYQGERRAPDRRVHGIFEGASGESYEGQWQGYNYDGAGQFNTQVADGVETCLGQFTANVLNGPGEINYADFTQYRGDIVGRVPRGYGVLTNASTGTTLVGRFLDGKLHGPGAELQGDRPVRFGIWRKGELARDEAQSANSGGRAPDTAAGAREASAEIAEAVERARSAEAQGVVLAERGRQSAAQAQQFAVDSRAAQTEESRGAARLFLYHYTDGGEYAGQIKDFDGALGVYTSGAPCCSGDVYAGAFDRSVQQSDHFSGFGVYTHGQVTTSPMARQSGQFALSAQTAFGEIEFKDGRIYRGAMHQDETRGPGVTLFPDGRQYVGDHSLERMHGLGVEYAADGSIARQGRWENGELAESA